MPKHVGVMKDCSIVYMTGAFSWFFSGQFN